MSAEAYALKILLSSYSFAPAIGGLETVSALLARELVRLGHVVVVITQTRSDESDREPYCIVRRPGWWQLLRLVRWCDVFLHNNISLRVAWPLLLVRRPWVVAHHIWLTTDPGFRDMLNRLKRACLRYADCISISRAMAAHFEGASVIIPDPYDDGVFTVRGDAPRNRSVIFLGRLVSTKGAADLLDALAVLAAGGLRTDLTVVGTGPEELPLRRQAEALGLAPLVTFAGAKRGHDLARCLNQHRVLCVPSRWNEPFGVVALEGMACGCIVVGSSGGGLGDAIGPGGLTYPNGDVAALAQCLRAALDENAPLAVDRPAVQRHLDAHRPGAVAQAYLDVLNRAVHGRQH
jgi:glycosyltransferase involved in cell wall biosynthesis